MKGMQSWWRVFLPYHDDPRGFTERWSDYRLARRYMKGPGKPPTRKEAERVWAWVRANNIKPVKLSDLPLRNLDNDPHLEKFTGGDDADQEAAK